MKKKLLLLIVIQFLTFQNLFSQQNYYLFVPVTNEKLKQKN